MKSIALTYGDPNGIGLEILNKLIIEKYFLKFKEDVLFKIYGDADLITSEASKYNIKIIDCKKYIKKEHSFDCLNIATQACIEKECSALITGPICKEKWFLADYKYSGQTEFLSEKTQKQAEMVFMTNTEFHEKSKALRILLLTRHIPLNKVSENLTEARFKEAIEILKNTFGQDINIGLAGLNPHAGEEGQIGTEEISWKSFLTDLNIKGPFSPDQIWFNMARNYLENKDQDFFVYLAPYHDQVLALIKAITSLKAVNVSLGLPFLRTSPDHGTAFNLVGKNKANIIPFWEAIKLCIEWYEGDSNSRPEGYESSALAS